MFQILINGMGYWPLVIGNESLDILRTRINFSLIQIDRQHLIAHSELANAGVGIPDGRDLRNVVDCTGVKFYLVGDVR